MVMGGLSPAGKDEVMAGEMPLGPVQFHPAQGSLLAHRNFSLENQPQVLSPSVYKQSKGAKIHR